MTIENLLRMESGFDCEEFNDGKDCETDMMASKDWVRFCRKKVYHGLRKKVSVPPNGNQTLQMDNRSQWARNDCRFVLYPALRYDENRANDTSKRYVGWPQDRMFGAPDCLLRQAFWLL